MLVALKVQHAIHHVLQHLGAGYGAFLVDVADDKDRDPLPLGHLHQRQGAVLHLTDAACGGVQRVVI